MIIKYYKGAEHPDIRLTWLSDAGTVIDFSAGYTFELKIGHGGSAAVLTKSTGIAGAQTSPNITVTFFAAELDSLPAGLYEGQLRANLTASNKDRYMRFWFKLLTAVT
jgi:hypothetical protein